MHGCETLKMTQRTTSLKMCVHPRTSVLQVIKGEALQGVAIPISEGRLDEHATFLIYRPR
jgi:hypothetical protein